MAELYTMSAEQLQTWNAWVASRPNRVKKLCLKFQPNRLYRYTKTGELVTPTAYFGKGTLEVNVLRPYKTTMVASGGMFGINPHLVEECDLPAGVLTLPFDEYEALQKDYLRLSEKYRDKVESLV